MEKKNMFHYTKKLKPEAVTIEIFVQEMSIDYLLGPKWRISC